MTHRNESIAGKEEADPRRGWDGVSCGTCGRPLGTDLEDEPDDDAERPICGECNRARNFDALAGA